MFLNYFNIFKNFFGNSLAWVGLEWNSERNFCCLFLGLSCPGLLRNKARMTFFSFLTFLQFFWEHSGPGRVGTELLTIFFLISFTAYPYSVWLEIKPKWCILIFWVLYYVFGNIPTWVGRNRSWNKVFFYLFFFLSWQGLAWNAGKKIFWIFLNFFNIFF